MRVLSVLIVLTGLLVFSGAHAAQGTRKAQTGAPRLMSIAETVIKMPLAKGVSLEDAEQSLKLRANALNMKLVAELPLSKQVEAITGKPSRQATIFQFCDAMTARQMLDYSLDFAAYLPCRIALVEDEKGQGWLVMMDLNMLINAANLKPELKAKAIEVRDMLESIMRAGANGEL
ncbi:DUF302 domain-containing protein [Thiobacter aerophilum]|uniref:DUF302 domain-containing protein n=1 Tax=Thiobacter aerophilum TaxID=3121275 RepID=A0ABV0EB63_9BURK